MRRRYKRKKKKYKQNRNVRISDLPKPIQYVILYGLAIYLVYAFFPVIWDLGWITSLGFIVSCALSFYRKTVLKDPRVIGFIAIGYVLTNAAVSTVLPMLYDELIHQSLLTAAIVGLIFLAIYWRGKQIINIGTQKITE